VAVRLRGSSLLVDYWTFCDIFVDHCFLFEERDAVVVDAGAHCGYFGAYALVRGAHAGYSLEPQRDNFTELQRNVASFRRQGYRWDAERCAVGGAEGTADLYLSSESWSHSLYAPTSGHAVGVERVRVRSLGGLLAELAEAHPDRSLAVKLNIRGRSRGG
jgi:FkbM family methyltransferase